MKFGMYVEAFDTMAEGNFQNPADAEKHYYVGRRQSCAVSVIRIMGT